MTKVSLALACSCVTVLFMPSLTVAADYPQWRGPNRTGISSETGLLSAWPPQGPKLLWRVTDIGEGYSTPSVVGDRLYVQTSRGLENEYVEARSIADGHQLWQTRLGRVGNPEQQQNFPGTRSTPTVDGDLLYALGSDGDLVCCETATGKEVWRKNLRADFAGSPGTWAYAESPLVDGDILVCTPGGKEATLVALDKRTGDIIWKSALLDGSNAAYASVTVVEIAGVKQYIQFLENGLVGVVAKTGQYLWDYKKTAEGSLNNMPTPVSNDSFVYSSSRQSGGGCVQVVLEDGKFEARQVYFGKKLPVSIGGAIFLNGYLYGTNSQGLLCVEFATGNVAWQARSIGAASLCYADGNFYLHGENGDLALVEATPEAYRERGRFTPPDQPDRGRAQAWTYPVVSNGRLYIRDLDSLWCYDIAAHDAVTKE